MHALRAVYLVVETQGDFPLRETKVSIEMASRRPPKHAPAITPILLSAASISDLAIHTITRLDGSYSAITSLLALEGSIAVFSVTVEPISISAPLPCAGLVGPHREGFTLAGCHP